MSEFVNDMVVGGLDQTMPLDKFQKLFIDKIDTIIQDSVEQNDPDIAGDALNYIGKLSQIGGLAFAKMVYTFKFQWKNFNRTDTFEEYMYDYCGKAKDTVRKSLRVWEFLVSGDVPKEYIEKIKLQSIKNIIPMSNLWYQEWDVTSQQWFALSNAPDVTTVNKLIREIKKVEPKKGSMQLQWDADDKIITVWVDSKPHSISLLYDEKDEIVKKGLDRILKASGILEKE